MAVREQGKLIVSGDERLSIAGATNTSTGLIGSVRERCTVGDQIGVNTRNDLVVELVGQQCVESIGHGVNPVDPNEPGMHLRLLDHESGIDDGSADQETRNLGGAIEGTERSADSLEKCSHTHCDGDQQDPEGEESASR